MKKFLSLAVIGVLTLAGCGTKEADIESAVQINYGKEGISFNFDANTFVNKNSNILGDNIQNMVDREEYDETELNDTYHIKITSDGMNKNDILPYDQIKDNKIVFSPKYNEEAYKEIGVKLPETNEVPINIDKEIEMLNLNISNNESSIESLNSNIKKNEEEINIIKEYHDEAVEEVNDKIKEMNDEIPTGESYWTEDDLKRYEEYQKKLEDNEYAIGITGENDKSEEVQSYQNQIKEAKEELEEVKNQIETDKKLLEKLNK